MTNWEAKYTIIEFMPVCGFKRYRESLGKAIHALEAQMKLKECIGRLDQPEYENITWSKEELVLLLKEIAKGVTST